MRKSKLTCIAVFLLILIVIAGCGANSPDAKQAASADSSSAKPAAERVYKHAMGEAKIPVKPEKVVTLQYVSQLLSIGVKPLGGPANLIKDLGEKAAGIENIGEAGKYNSEKILELQPELIIAGDVEQEAYDKLSKIAPTVVVPWMNHDVFGHVKVMGDIMNRQSEAEAWSKAFRAKFQAVREQIQSVIEPGKTAAIYNIRPKEIYVYGVRNFGFTIYKALELTPPPPVKKEIEKDPNFWAVPVSLEQLPEYASDYLFVSTFGDDDSKKRLDEISKTALWANLPAVKNNRVYMLNLDTWFGYTPHDIEKQLQEIVSLLKKS
ncbi:ABC transporter substrate-binding protein [Paenibacillus sp. MZ04-78.2]|uniref:ABC transporter substrate-binding protein n=1 Tax=Paenibacillus sp. MZ04-78.2 TaxID=2962034 RepID=UPI0020B8B483|nr:ABC transporter substrate-binding protein [Paenibacillus sp. MZ04-78.2]MCP3776652.1 ABC transporter substrate-binding protein [Paenibacillus sp. MZ04-78.2]